MIGVPTGVNENVLTLEIAVRNFVVVEMLNGQGDLKQGLLSPQ